jgi:hypothetical protein
MALHELAEAGDASSDRTVNLRPIADELFMSEPRLAANAIDELYHPA